MQKKLIALAVAGLVSGGAFAQSTNVTMYGVADVFYGHATSSGKSGQTMIESGGLAGSRLGFKGTEDLGGGVKALFTLEYNLAMDANSGIGDLNSTGTPIAAAAATGATSAALASNGQRWTGTQARQQMLGLTGDFGTVVGGRLQSAGYYFAATYVPAAGTAFDGANLIGGNLVAGTGARFNNAFGYVSPTFSGVTLEWDHARLSEDANNAYGANAAKKDNTANEFSAKYSNGPLNAQLVYAKITNDQTVASDAVTQMGLGGSYDFGVAKAMVQYKDYKNASVNGGAKRKMWALSASVPVGADSIDATYATAKLGDTVASDDVNGVALRYVHPMSKRTKVYGAFARVSNDGVGVTAITATAGLAPLAGGSATLYGFGVDHAF